MQCNIHKVTVNGLTYQRDAVQVIIKPNSFHIFDLGEKRYSLALCDTISRATSTAVEHSIDYFNQCMKTQDITASNIHQLLAIQDAHPEYSFPIVLASNTQTWFALFRDDPNGSLSKADVLTYDPNPKTCAKCVLVAPVILEAHIMLLQMNVRQQKNSGNG